ncbi:methionine synthase II (cobalamin-independent) [Alkalibacillus flavidus]|uniref:Methionine synthase II (Cobalamin-independent) n=1 Tax=Alkalibacillus flavidus TaxID=546021 RepID=A0ABV2KTU4_9BACI
MTNETIPFRADHVGSLLRSERLHQARADLKAGQISADGLRQVENEEINRIVDKQIEIGLQAVTDGEFRRTWFHLDFMELFNGMEGYVPDQGYQFANNTKPNAITSVTQDLFHLTLITLY